MTITRRNVLLGATAVAALAPVAGRAQTSEVVIGVIYPFSGANAQQGVDAQKAYETALEINKDYDFDLPAKGEGFVWPRRRQNPPRIRRSPIRSAEGPRRNRTPDHPGKVCAVIGTYQSAVAVTVSQICERYQIPFISADTSPSLHRRGLKFYFRAAPHDEMYSTAMFDFFDAMKKKGTKIETLALFHEDTIFGTDSANAQLKLAADRGYKIVADIKYRANSPSLSADRCSSSRRGQCRRADALELHHRRYSAGQDHGRTRYKPNAIVAQDAGFSEKALYDAVGDKLEGAISRGTFSLDLATKRPMVGAINAMFKEKSGKDFNDLTSREFMGLIVMAEAINRAKSTDGDKIREALVATDIAGEQTIMPWKRIKFDEMGQNNDADPVLLQYIGGKFVTISPAQGAIAEAVWPMK